MIFHNSYMIILNNVKYSFILLKKDCFQIVPGRMSLLIIMLLVVINLFTGQPKVGGGVATRHDKYLLICISFIVAAVVEYGLILALQELDK